jgi:hypothetical protein
MGVDTVVDLVVPLTEVRPRRWCTIDHGSADLAHLRGLAIAPLAFRFVAAADPGPVHVVAHGSVMKWCEGLVWGTCGCGLWVQRRASLWREDIYSWVAFEEIASAGESEPQYACTDPATSNTAVHNVLTFTSCF